MKIFCNLQEKEKEIPYVNVPMSGRLLLCHEGKVFEIVLSGERGKEMMNAAVMNDELKSHLSLIHHSSFRSHHSNSIETSLF
jgi:hypothetical protein